MLRDRFPEMFDATGKLAYGLLPVEVVPSGRFFLIVKATKEAILTAGLNAELRIYLARGGTGPARLAGLATAFLDDGDEPLVIVTPLFAGDAFLHDLSAVMSQETFEIHFVDELDREILSVAAVHPGACRWRETVSRLAFPTFNLDRGQEAVDSLRQWFGKRGAEEEALAFVLGFRTDIPSGRATPGDAARPGPGPTTSAPRAAALPGRSEQERDVAALLERAFPQAAVVSNPTREHDGKEFTDNLVITGDLVLVVQAKDSPNTRASRDRSMDRKRAVTRAHVGKAARQLRGAMRRLASQETVRLRAAGKRLPVRLGDRALRGLVLVQELFDGDVAACSAEILGVAADRGALCVLLTFGGCTAWRCTSRRRPGCSRDWILCSRPRWRTASSPRRFSS